MTAPGQLDVVVVGAGLAGLTAASRLEEASLRVAVLEARDEVGGRTRSRRLAGQVVDLGGEFVGPHHRRVRALARELDVPVRSSGLARARTQWLIDQGRRVGSLPPLSVTEALAAVRALRGLARRARSVPPDEPWRAPGAAELDSRSAREWLEERSGGGRAYRLIAALLEGLATVRLEQLSLLHVLWWIARPGGPIAAMRDVNAMRPSGGAQELSRRLAARLREPVRLSTPVRGVRQLDGGALLVEGRGGAQWRTRCAVVCVPLPAVEAIAFDPPLDDAQRALHRELRFGRATSVVVAGEGPPRARHGLVVGGDELPLAWRAGHGAKGLFLGEDGEEGTPALAGRLARAFGLSAPPAETEAVRWAQEPFVGGTYVAFAPGQLVRHGPHLRRPHGRVHFAGAERSSWPDSMEGALESGTLAADRVAAALRGTAQAS